MAFINNSGAHIQTKPTVQLLLSIGSIVMYCAMIMSYSAQHEGIEVTLTQDPQPKPDSSTLVFGKTFADHMLTVNWTIKDGWGVPKIGPYSNFSLAPALSALHYGTEVCV